MCPILSYQNIATLTPVYYFVKKIYLFSRLLNIIVPEIFATCILSANCRSLTIEFPTTTAF